MHYDIHTEDRGNHSELMTKRRGNPPKEKDERK
jgi:hypothetical protein